MNPSTAQVAFGDLQFASRNVEVITRAGSAAGISTADKELDGKTNVFECSGGLLKVGVRAQGKDLAGKGEATILALQAQVRQDGKEDTLITSDYAMLYGTEISLDEIVYTQRVGDGMACGGDAGNKCALFTNPLTALANAETQKIEYTQYGDRQGLNLKEKLALHYSWTTKSKKACSHEVMTLADAEKKFNLKVDFSLVQYEAGEKDKTQDSKYATIDANTGIMKVKYVKEDGSVVDPSDDNMAEACINRQPLVRVRVMDGNNVVLYGFIKVRIVKNANIQDVVAGVYDGGTKDIALCDRSIEMLKTPWEWISDNILGTIGMSNEEFHSRYYLEENSSSKTKQYTEPGGAEVSKYLGNVVEVEQTAGSVTKLLQWNMDIMDRQYIYENFEDHSTTIYVKFAPQDVERDAPVYVGLKVTVSKKPAGTIGDKISQYWFENQTAVYLNTLVPESGKRVYEAGSRLFKNNLDNVWSGNVVKSYNTAITPSGYKYFFDPSVTSVAGKTITYKASGNKTCHYNIQTVDGRKVAWTPENEVKYIAAAYQGVYNLCEAYVGNVKIATLDQESGEITLEYNDVSKEMLNSGRLATALKVGVAFYNSCQYGPGSLNYRQIVPVTGNTFTAKFYRPINVAAAETVPSFQDAAEGSRGNVFDMLAFTDWRNQPFTGNNGWYFGYYGVSRVTLDKEHITTTLGGGQLGTTLLSDKTSQIIVEMQNDQEIAITNPSSGNSQAILDKVKKCMGEIVVKNIGYSVETYQLRLPLTIEYLWGKQTISVDVTVKTTLQSRHK